MPTLLVVDDEPSILLAFQRAYRNSSIHVLTAGTAAEGLALAESQHPDVIVLDVQMPDQSGLETFRQLREKDARTPILFITGKATTDTAIEAMKLGALDYLFKPLELAQLRLAIDRAFALSRMMHVPAVLPESGIVDDRADAIIRRCPAMSEVYKAIGRVAGQEVTVFITGETGTGKELVARAVYQHSKRAAGPFLEINCAAIPEQLLESELFGHEKGAFTGADRRRIGKFEQSSGGTIFLDEIGDMSLVTQSKMLRLLQEQRFERLGGNETVQTDVRLLAATNRDLAGMVARGEFRQDLYYRLSVFTIPLPPLRDRGDDLTLLIQHYLRRFNQELSKDVQGWDPRVLTALQTYSWPGNIRELQSFLKQAMLQTSGSVLLAESLPAALDHSRASSSDSPALPAEPWQPRKFIEARLLAGSNNIYAEAMAQLEILLLQQVLQATEGNQSRAAQLLGITRGSLRNKLREHGIVAETKVSGPSFNQNKGA